MPFNMFFLNKSKQCKIQRWIEKHRHCYCSSIDQKKWSIMAPKMEYILFKHATTQYIYIFQDWRENEKDKRFQKNDHEM